MSSGPSLLDYGTVAFAIAASVILITWSQTGALDLVSPRSYPISGVTEASKEIYYGPVGVASATGVACVLFGRLLGSSPTPALLKALARIAVAVLACACILALVACSRRTPIDRLAGLLGEQASLIPPQGGKQVVERPNYPTYGYNEPPTLSDTIYVPEPPWQREIAVGPLVALLDCDKRSCGLHLVERGRVLDGRSLLGYSTDPPPLRLAWDDPVIVTRDPLNGGVVVALSEVWECQMQNGICWFSKLNFERVADRTTVPRPWLWGGLAGLLATSLLLWRRRRLVLRRRSQEQLLEGAFEQDGRVVLSKGILPAKRGEHLERTDILLTRCDASITSIACLAASPLIGGILARLIP